MSRLRRDSETSTDSWSIVEDDNNESSDHFSIHATTDEEQNGEDMSEIEEPIVEEPTSDEDDLSDSDSDVTQYSSDEEEVEEVEEEDEIEEPEFEESPQMVLKQVDGYYVCSEEDEDDEFYEKYEKIAEKTTADIIGAPMKLLTAISQFFSNENTEEVDPLPEQEEVLEASEPEEPEEAEFDPTENPVRFFGIVLGVIFSTLLVISCLDSHLKSRLVRPTETPFKVLRSYDDIFEYVGRNPEDSKVQNVQALQQLDKVGKMETGFLKLLQLLNKPPTVVSAQPRLAKNNWININTNSSFEISPFALYSTNYQKYLESGPVPPTNVCEKEENRKIKKIEKPKRSLHFDSLIIRKTSGKSRAFSKVIPKKIQTVDQTERIPYVRPVERVQKFQPKKILRQPRVPYRGSTENKQTKLSKQPVFEFASKSKNQQVARTQSKEIQTFYNPKSARKVYKRSNPKSSPCFENNTSFSPCETSKTKNLPMVIHQKNQSDLSYKPRTHRNKRMTAYHKSYNVTNSKKASQSMRKSFSLKSDEEQCEGRQISKYLPKRKSIMYKPPLPCKAPKFKPTIPSKVHPSHEYAEFTDEI